jgi:hypothetical protein
MEKRNVFMAKLGEVTKPKEPSKTYRNHSKGLEDVEGCISEVEFGKNCVNM